MKPESMPVNIKQVKFHGKKDHIPTVAGTKILYLVSIKNNERCERQYLKATIEAAMRSGFHMTLILVDKPYAFNLWEEQNPQEIGKRDCESYALRQGRNYLIRNLNYICEALFITQDLSDDVLASKTTEDLLKWINAESLNTTQHILLDDQHAIRQNLKPKFEIITWQQWLDRHQDFLDSNQEEINSYMQHPTMQESIERSSDTYLQRTGKYNNELEKIKSRHYITTETHGLIFGAIAGNYDFMSYPSKIMPAFDTLIKNIKQDAINSEHPLFKKKITLEYLSIDFILQKSNSNRSSPGLSPGAVTPQPHPENDEMEKNFLPPAESNHTPINTPTSTTTITLESAHVIYHLLHDRSIDTSCKAEGILAIVEANRKNRAEPSQTPEIKATDYTLPTDRNTEIPTSISLNTNTRRFFTPDKPAIRFPRDLIELKNLCTKYSVIFAAPLIIILIVFMVHQITNNINTGSTYDFKP